MHKLYVTVRYATEQRFPKWFPRNPRVPWSPKKVDDNRNCQKITIFCFVLQLNQTSAAGQDRPD